MTIWMSFLGDRPQSKTAVIGTISSVQTNRESIERHFWMLCPPRQTESHSSLLYLGGSRYFKTCSKHTNWCHWTEVRKHDVFLKVSRGDETLCNRLSSESVSGPMRTVECVNRWHPLTVKAGSTLLLLPSSPCTPAFCRSTFDPSVTPPPPPTPDPPLDGDTAEPSILSPPILLASLLPSSVLQPARNTNAVIMLHFTATFPPPPPLSAG